ncbi:hypothetical protein EON67_01730 [archaeon]|nr:MAG: hypothetical protein EON67_01730 [archaeon]
MQAAGAYTLAYLSKFGNPLAANVSQLFPTLQRKGVRLHVCTGDTYLTLQAVLRDMHALPSTSIHRVPGGDAIVLHDSLPFAEVLWDDRMVPRLDAHFAAAMPVSDGQSEWHVVVASIRRRLQSPSAAGGAHASVVAHAASPLEQVLMVANAGAQVVIFASSRALEALAAHRDDMQLNAVLSHPNIVFAFYRIKQDRKPLAVALFQGIDEVCLHAFARVRAQAQRASVEHRFVWSVRACMWGVQVEPLFIGDGPNDADALSATPHSVAIAHGSSTAKAAANVEVQTSACLPDLINMAQLFHGGRAIILRDIVFTGTYIVVMLSLAAHMNNFSSGGTKIKYFEGLPHSPRINAQGSAV